MTGLAEERRFVVAPSFNRSIGVACKRAATGTFEMCFFGQLFRKVLADKVDDDKAGYYRPKDQFHRYLFFCICIEFTVAICSQSAYSSIMDRQEEKITHYHLDMNGRFRPQQSALTLHFGNLRFLQLTPGQPIHKMPSLFIYGVPRGYLF